LGSKRGAPEMSRQTHIHTYTHIHTRAHNYLQTQKEGLALGEHEGGPLACHSSLTHSSLPLHEEGLPLCLSQVVQTQDSEAGAVGGMRQCERR